MLHSAIASQDECKYRMKIINPKAKKDVVVIDWHGVGDKFKNPIELKQKLIDTLGKYVPPASAIDDFSVGYLHGRPQTKSWIHSSVRARLAHETEISPDHTRFGVKLERLHLLTVIPNYVFVVVVSLYTPDLAFSICS